MIIITDISSLQVKILQFSYDLVGQINLNMPVRLAKKKEK